MQSDQTEKLVILQQELSTYNQVFEKTILKIEEHGMPKNPIFVLHQEHIPLGIPIIEKDIKGGKWNIMLSTMEEFIKKGLVRIDRIDEFQSLYQGKTRHYCLFVLSELGAQFIFLPRIFIDKE
jgi:hypothetical protein